MRRITLFAVAIAAAAPAWADVAPDPTDPSSPTGAFAWIAVLAAAAALAAIWWRRRR